MKLDMINIMQSNININNSSKNENIKVPNEFIDTLNQTSNINLITNNLLENEEDQNLEELMMKLIEMMIKTNIENIDINNLEKEIENNIEQILNSNKIKANGILNEFDIDEYFHGNKADTQEVINILNSIKKENGIEEINSLLEKLNGGLAVNEDGNTNKNITYEKLINNLGRNAQIGLLESENIVGINNNKLTEVDSHIKDNNLIGANEKMYYNNDKDISILKEIAKDDSSKFVINENKFSVNGNLNLSTNEVNSLVEVRTTHFSQDVMESINYLKNNNLQELKVNLNPKELGEITIRLVKSDKETKLSVVVAKDEVYSLVNKNLQEIAKHLENLDIKVNEISVDIKNDNQSAFSDDSNHQFKENQGQKRNNYKNEVEKIEGENAKLTNEDNVNLLA